MSELFLTVLNMSISASWLVLAVQLLRLILKKTPKWLRVLLQGFMAIRLICPFSFESVFSLIPSSRTVPNDIMTDMTPEIYTRFNALHSAVNPVISESFSPEPLSSINPLQIWITLATVTWLTGIAIMLIYTAVSYLLLQRKVATAVRFRDNLFQSEYVVSPFVLGLIKPRIYLPFQIDSLNLEYVIAHEAAHIRRKDHWWKPFGFILLALHWFNPMMWLGYITVKTVATMLGLDIWVDIDYQNRIVVINHTAPEKPPEQGEVLSRTLTIVETRPSGIACEYSHPYTPYCIYSFDADENLYRVLWTDWDGLNEKDRVIVEFTKLEILNYDVYPNGGWTPPYEITATSVRLAEA